MIKRYEKTVLAVTCRLRSMMEISLNTKYVITTYRVMLQTYAALLYSRRKSVGGLRLLYYVTDMITIWLTFLP